MNIQSRISILILSLVVALLLAYVSIYGILNEDLYAKETDNWKTQSIGQDKIDLFLVLPVLLITSFLTFRNIKNAALLWLGTMLYLVYTFMIYSFAVRFNSMYPFYCITLGTCFYSIVYFFLHKPKYGIRGMRKRNNWIFVTAAYFVIIALMFYALWLSEILPATLDNSLPGSLVKTGLAINPVHTLDLALLLPAIFITGIFLLKDNPLAQMMTPAFLSFFILMNITIAFLMMELGDRDGALLSMVMVALAVFSLILLIYFIRKIEIKR